MFEKWILHTESVELRVTPRLRCWGRASSVDNLGMTRGMQCWLPERNTERKMPDIPELRPCALTWLESPLHSALQQPQVGVGNPGRH